MAIHAAAGVHEHAARLAIDATPIGGRIADLGAGSGALSARLRDHGFDVTSVDREATPGTGVVEADITSALLDAVAGNTFDTVMAIEVIEHLDNPIALLEQSHSILRPGGTIVVSTPNVLHPYSRLKFLLKGTYWHFDREAYFSTGHTSPLPAWLLQLHLERCGFEYVAYGYAGKFENLGWRRLLTTPLTWLARLDKVPMGALGDCNTLFVRASKAVGHS